jgi:putative membrane protein
MAGSVLPALLPRLGLLLAFSLLVTYFHGIILSFKVP